MCNSYLTRSKDGGVPASHASSHSDGATDEITVEDLATDSTDTSLVLKPDGTGGISFGSSSGGGTVQGTNGTLDIRAADEGSISGNNRGEYSVDFQTQRSAADQVASGSGAFIGSSKNCVASNSYTGILCAQSSTASGLSSIVVGGAFNYSRNTYSFVGNGSGNITDGHSSFIGSGVNNNIGASGVEGVIGGGDTNTITQTNSFVGGGKDNDSHSANSTIPGGLQAKTTQYGQLAQASGRFTANGDAQYSRAISRNQTTDATPTEIFLDGSSIRLSVASGRTIGFLITVTATQTGGTAGSVGDTRVWKLFGAIKNIAGTTSLVGTVDSTEVGDAATSAWTMTATANDTNDTLKLEFTGEVNKNVNIVSAEHLTETVHA